MTRQELAVRHAAATNELSAILALGDNVTEEQVTLAETLSTEMSELRGKLDRFASLSAHTATVEAATAFINAPVNPLTQSAGSTTLVSAPQASQAGQLAAPSGGTRTIIPAHVAAGTPRNFKARDGQTAAERAYQFGMWFRATSCRDQRAAKFCQERGIALMWQDSGNRVHQFTNSEGVNTAGGYLVPPQFDQDIIDLREQYGVFRRLLKRRAMTSDTVSIPRRASGVTAYFVGEDEAATESQKSWGLVQLTAKKLMVNTKITSELSEDSIIDIADDLMNEISYAFSKKEDECAVSGDATSTYGGIRGVRTLLLDIDGAGTDAAGVRAATGNLWSEIILADFNYTKALLPEYADTADTVWVCSKQFYHAVMERLMLAAGGITDAMIAAGAPPRFMGSDVVFSQAMPTVEADTSVMAVYGDFKKAGDFGDRRQHTLAASEHSSFRDDVTDVKGTTRFDINWHDLGDGTTPGPVVGLRTIT